MATKKPKPSKERAPSATATGRMNILLEQIQEQNRAVMEAVTGFRREAKADLAEFRAEVNARFEAVEAAIRINSDGIERNGRDVRALTARIEVLEQAVLMLSAELREVKSDVAVLKSDVAEVRAILAGQPSADQLGSLERRVAALEKRAGITAG